ncbi:MAG: manganese catalase family protein [Blautia sp.]
MKIHGNGWNSHFHGKGKERWILFMWNYEKRLQYPVRYQNAKCQTCAVYYESKYGGPDGEISASHVVSYLSALPCRTECLLAELNDIGTQELAHLEMVSTIVHQLTRDLYYGRN